jgi:hypothetical protein
MDQDQARRIAARAVCLAIDYGGYAASFPVPQLTGRAHLVPGPDRCSRPDRGTPA